MSNDQGRTKHQMPKLVMGNCLVISHWELDLLNNSSGLAKRTVDSGQRNLAVCVGRPPVNNSIPAGRQTASGSTR